MEAPDAILPIAPCGMNCSVCIAYLRERNKCPGCRGPDDKKSISRAQCKIKKCETFQDGNSQFCFECKDFPCKRLKQLDKRYRTRYNMSMIENLQNIEKSGMTEFLENERSRWTCPKCGGTICVHKGYCYSCAKSSDK